MLNLLSSTPFPGTVDDYLASTRDVILLGARDGGAECGWMRILLMMEAYVQAPFFVIGAIALFRSKLPTTLPNQTDAVQTIRGSIVCSPRTERGYVLTRVAWMVAYGATTVTAVIPTLAAVFTTPVKPPLTTAEILKFLVAYVPFLLIPFSIMVDMGMRCVRLINLAQERKMA